MTGTPTTARDLVNALALGGLCAATIALGVAPRVTALLDNRPPEVHVGPRVLAAPCDLNATALGAVAAGPGRLLMHVVARQPGAYRMRLDVVSPDRCIRGATLAADGQAASPMSVTHSDATGGQVLSFTAPMNLSDDPRELTVELQWPPGCDGAGPRRLNFADAAPSAQIPQDGPSAPPPPNDAETDDAPDAAVPAHR